MKLFIDNINTYETDKERMCSCDNTNSGLMKNPRNGRSPQGNVDIDISSSLIDLIHQANTVLFNDTISFEDSVLESCKTEMAVKNTKKSPRTTPESSTVNDRSLHKSS